MSIMIIQPFLSYGGAEAVSVQLANRMSQRGHETKVVSLFIDRGRLPHEAERASIVVAPELLGKAFSLSKLALLLLGFPTLLILVFKNAQSTTVLNPHNFPSLWVAGIVAFFKKIPVVWTCHNLPQTPFTQGLAAKLLNPPAEFLNGFFARRCKKVFVVSGKVKKEVFKRYGVKSQVAHPGIDYAFYSKVDPLAVRERYSWKKKFILLQVGRLARQKNHSLSIESLSKISKRIKEAILVIVGDGKEEQSLRLLVQRLRVSDKVFFVGYQPPNKMKDFYAAADLHLSPAYETEGFNLAPLEALCCWTVSLVAEKSGVDEVIKRERIGVVARPRIMDFSKAILKAYKNRGLLRDMGEKGNLWVKNNLSWRGYADKFEETVC